MRIASSSASSRRRRTRCATRQTRCASPPSAAGARGGLGRTLLLLTIAAILALALSEDLRSKVLDMMFGAEEEFDYSSTAADGEPAPAGASAA